MPRVSVWIYAKAHNINRELISICLYVMHAVVVVVATYMPPPWTIHFHVSILKMYKYSPIVLTKQRFSLAIRPLIEIQTISFRIIWLKMAECNLLRICFCGCFASWWARQCSWNASVASVAPMSIDKSTCFICQISNGQEKLTTAPAESGGRGEQKQKQHLHLLINLIQAYYYSSCTLRTL